MPKTNARIGKGTTLGMGATVATGTPTFTTLAEVFEIPFPEDEHADVEATHYSSPNGREEFLIGWATGQDMEVQLNYTATTFASLLAARGTEKAFKITLPDGATLVFDANVKKVGGAIPNKDRITNTVTLKPTTAATFTPGS